MVPAQATPLSLRATVSNVIASLPHCWQGLVVMVPGDISRCVILSITAPYVLPRRVAGRIVRTESRGREVQLVTPTYGGGVTAWRDGV